MRSKRVWIALLVVIAVIVCGSVVYVEQYYRADAAAEEALVSDGNVSVERTGYGWYFDGPGEESALVFYPGGKVEETAYAPLLHELAAEGLDACLVKVPFRLAFLGIGKADEAMKAHEYAHWYVGGHSLGGVAAAFYAAEHGGALDGIVLLGAYSTKKLSDDLSALSIRGSEDRVLDLKAYQENLGNDPADTDEVVIKGGNHAQFGSYGVQKGDGTAQISPAEQWGETTRAIISWVKNAK